MKALTICQPYAHLIVQGRKTCENRTWATNYRGRLYIHAGKSRQWLDLDDNGLDEGIPVDRMAFGAVIAMCDLVACLHIDSRLLPEWTAKMTEEQRDHVSGPHCWIVSNVTPIGPWSYRGAQGLFDINDLDEVANRELGITSDRGAK